MTNPSQRNGAGQRRGFTLIELLIVVVIIGILAAVAIPKFGQTRERTFVANMKADLRNLQTAMEMYYHSNFTSYAGAVLGTPQLPFSPQEPITINLTSTPSGWSAVADHPSVAESCAIFVGTAAAVAPATDAGVITCDEVP